MVEDRIYTREKHAATKGARVPQLHPICFDDDDYIRVRCREAIIVREMGRKPRWVRFPYAEIEDFLNVKMDQLWQYKKEQ